MTLTGGVKALAAIENAVVSQFLIRREDTAVMVRGYFDGVNEPEGCLLNGGIYCLRAHPHPRRGTARLA